MKTTPILPRRSPSAAFTAVALGIVVSLAAWAPTASAAPPTKEECIEAHGKAQDVREKGQLADARTLFLACAQSACPALLQADCARGAEDAARLVPSVTFAARDGKGADLPNTQVYVDDKLFASRLDEGKAFDVNPGKHVVRFSHLGVDVVQQVVVSQGERGRTLVASFGEALPPGAIAGLAPVRGDAPPATAPPPASRSAAPLVVAGVGVALLATGAALLVVGNGKIPDNCSVSSKQCAAPAGDASFDRAHSASTLMNGGWAVGAAGVLGVAGGLVWYFAQTPAGEPKVGDRFAPWFVAGGGGVVFSGRL